MDIRARIEARLEELGLNRSQASRRAGKSPTFLRDFLDNPTATMNLRSAEQLAAALGVSPCWLAFGDASGDDALSQIVGSWNGLRPEQRKAIADLVRTFVDR